jgi:hypothetical protein
MRYVGVVIAVACARGDDLSDVADKASWLSGAGGDVWRGLLIYVEYDTVMPDAISSAILSVVDAHTRVHPVLAHVCAVARQHHPPHALLSRVLAQSGVQAPP